MRALAMLVALIPALAQAETPPPARPSPPPGESQIAPISAPAPGARPASPELQTPTTPRAPAAKPETALLPADLAVQPTAQSAAQSAAQPAAQPGATPAPQPPALPLPKPARPKPTAPGTKPAPPTTAETLDWAQQVRDALAADVAIPPPTPLSPPEVDVDGGRAPTVAPRPRKRPARLTWSGSAAEVCNDPRLAGEAVAPITDDGACGVAKPVRLTSVAGVALTSPVYIGCPAALALADWLSRIAVSAPDLLDARISSITPFASYACRNRNSRAGGRLSEHAKGRAIDVGRFGLSDGRSVTVLEGWRDPKTSGFLKRAWRTACNRFGTVLGPGSDIHHQDHFHLDVAKHRSGAYCR